MRVIPRKARGKQTLSLFQNPTVTKELPTLKCEQKLAGSESANKESLSVFKVCFCVSANATAAAIFWPAPLFISPLLTFPFQTFPLPSDRHRGHGKKKNKRRGRSGDKGEN